MAPPAKKSRPARWRWTCGNWKPACSTAWSARPARPAKPRWPWRCSISRRVPRLPLDVAADAGPLFGAHRAPGEYRVDGRAKVAARDGNIVFRTAAIHLPTVYQFAPRIEQEEIRRAGGAVSPGGFLGLVVAIGKREAQPGCLGAQSIRRVFGKLRRVVRRDGDDPQPRAGILLQQFRKAGLHVFHVRTVRAQEHYEQPFASDERIERDGLAGDGIRQRKSGSAGSQREHRGFNGGHDFTISD